jgi:ABC-type multidrug transport system fused ATPase/permease subunit
MQGLGGVKDIKLNGRERFFLESFSNHIQENAKIGTKATTLNLVPRIYLEILAVFAMAGLVIVFIIQNKPLDSLITILGIFIVAAFRMIPSANRIMMSIQNIRAAYPTVDLVYNEFCNINQEAKKNNIDEQKLNFSNQIVIKNLDFSYTNKLPYTIENISLVINKGESIGLIGPSGSGKSTLVDLVLGLLKPNHGEINIDGVNIENILRSWQKQIGYVSQSIYLTDDTLRNNIAFGINESQIDDFSINRAIKAAQLEEFINTLPDGINTNVGERGVRLSGGQRQRIGIARALYPDPSVLVLDEATSALDTNTEKEVMNAVNGLHGEKTLIIIAHRLTTVENCDKIYKISNGKLVYSGSPQKIL